MSGECDKCDEHCLECKCGIGCEAAGSKIKKYSLKPVESIPIPEKEIRVEVGYQSVIIDKMFGPQIFANLKITADPNSNTWLIERQKIDDGEWVEWVRIPGQLDIEFKESE